MSKLDGPVDQLVSRQLIEPAQPIKQVADPTIDEDLLLTDLAYKARYLRCIMGELVNPVNIRKKDIHI